MCIPKVKPHARGWEAKMVCIYVVWETIHEGYFQNTLLVHTQYTYNQEYVYNIEIMYS